MKLFFLMRNLQNVGKSKREMREVKIIKKITQRLKEKYWYSERIYQYVISGIMGWAITLVIFIVWILKFYVFD